MDHEAAGEVAIHGLEEGDAHDEGVWEGGEGEEGDGPVEAAMFGENIPEEESAQDDDFLERVSGDESVVHGVRVVGGYEVEGEKRDGENGDESVYAGALVRREDLPPTDGTVGEDHGHVQWHYGCENIVDVLASNHG